MTSERRPTSTRCRRLPKFVRARRAETTILSLSRAFGICELSNSSVPTTQLKPQTFLSNRRIFVTVAFGLCPDSHVWSHGGRLRYRGRPRRGQAHDGDSWRRADCSAADDSRRGVCIGCEAPGNSLSDRSGDRRPAAEPLSTRPPPRT